MSFRSGIPCVALVGLVLAACSSTTPDATEKETMDLEVQGAVKELKAKDPSLARWFDSAYGYAVFPSIGKAGIGVGGATGRGYVYERGSHVGYSRMSQATIGLQLGAQSYREVIFFEDKAAFDRFTQGEFEFSAQVSAVAVNAGASADANYENGVAVFTMAKGGLMYEASVGGQKFTYETK